MLRYEVFDHTADLGIRFRGRDLEDLFESAAFAVFDIMTELDAVEERQTHRFGVEGSDREILLVNFLRELLYRFDGMGFLVRRCVVRIAAAVSEGQPTGVPVSWRLEAEAAGEPFDPARHRMKTEIKAVTYHGIEVLETPSEWRGRVICDV